MMTDETEISFDPDFATPAEWAAMYRSRGMQIVPARFPMKVPGDKRPALADWKDLQDDIASDAIFARLFGGPNIKPNMGLITGSCSQNIVVIDLDDYKTSHAAQWFREATDGIEPETWKQTTGGGGRQYFFKLPPGVVIGNCRTALGVDIRGQGGFAMIPPSYHMSGKQYEWVRGSEPWAIPVDTASDDLVAAIKTLIEENGGSSVPSSSERVERTASPVTDFDAFGGRVDGREEYMMRLVWAAVVDWHRECPIPPTEAEAQAKMREAYGVYERSVKSRIADDGTTKTARLEREGRGPTAFAEKWQSALRQWAGKVAHHAASVPAGRSVYQQAASEVVTFDPETGEVKIAEVVPPRPLAIETVEAFSFSVDDVPPRPWIVYGMLLHGYVGLVVGTGGAGKSLFTLQLACSIASGKDWGGFAVRKPARVMILNAEDDIAEQRRRLLAIKERMPVEAGGVGDRLILVNDPPSLLVTHRDPATKTQVATPLVGALVETIKARQVDVLIVDPFAETLSGDENASEDIRWVMKVWRDEIARATGCAVLLVHHTPKYSAAMAGDANAARGSGAINAAARTSWTVFPMTGEEAEAAGIPDAERHRYVRVDDAKANYGLLSGTARWFQKQEVDIGNAAGEYPSDKVGVLAPWKVPGPFSGISYEAINDCLDAIERGLEDDELRPTGQLYSMRWDSGARYVVALVQERLGVDEERAKRIARTWRETGLLIEADYQDPQARKARKGLRVDNAKRPTPGTVEG